jgi:diguanylate cyclase (GGDEF)-like protein
MSMADLSVRRVAALVAISITTIAAAVAVTAMTAGEGRWGAWVAAGVVGFVSAVLIAGCGCVAASSIRRTSERDRNDRELRELLLVSDSIEESQMLLIRHIERIVPGAGAAVLVRGESDGRVHPALADHVDQTPLRAIQTERLRPRACLAMRLGHPHERRLGDQPLTACEVCGSLPGEVQCEPLLVAGEVAGAVVVANDGRLPEAARAAVRASVAQAAPVLVGQRTLALAERRAVSDLLTGLPNRRAAEETIARMTAHAGRTLSPLSVILLDLDRFSALNQLHGHDQGDKALAAIGRTLAGVVRASDFAARYGGEEFLVLLPDTDRNGALETAEKLRRAVEQTELPGVGVLTASLGVACLPEDAVEPGALLQRADRAMASAKTLGRNRVETAERSTGGLPGF